jgi:hypothetical protein
MLIQHEHVFTLLAVKFNTFLAFENKIHFKRL